MEKSGRPRSLDPSPEKSLNMTDAAQTFTTRAETFTTGAANAFRDSVEKSVNAVSELNTHSKKNLEALVASMTAASRGAETLGSQAMAYTKKSMEDQMTAAKNLASARSVQEVLELQSAYAKSAYEAYVSELGRMSETMTASVREALAPINERVTAVVERIQTVR